jgi:hypothetical protein
MSQEDAAVVVHPSRAGGSAARVLDVASYLALVCAVVGLPFCLWVLASYLSQLGPEWLYWLVTQNDHDALRKLIDRAQLIGLCLSIGGLVAGGLLVWWSRRRGIRRPVARWALILGIAGVSFVAIGVVAMIVSFMAWEGPT